MVVIDHIDNLTVSPEPQHNLLSVLQGLEMGMGHLAEFVRRREVEALERYEKDQEVFFDDFGNGLELLLGSMFDWFSVSLVNYMHTVQLIPLMETKGWNLEDLRRKPAQRELRAACDRYAKELLRTYYSGVTR